MKIKVETQENLQIQERMTKGGIPGTSVAYFNPGKPIRPEVFGETDIHSANPHVDVDPDTVFGAASLSKPVFSYLVLKMIADKKFTKPFTLDTPISDILPIQDFYKNVLKIEVSDEFDIFLLKQAFSTTTNWIICSTRSR